MQTLVVASVLMLAQLRPGAHCCLIPAIGGGSIPASGSWDGAVPMAGVWINKEKKWRLELTTKFCKDLLERPNSTSATLEGIYINKECTQYCANFREILLTALVEARHLRPGRLRLLRPELQESPVLRVLREGQREISHGLCRG